MDPLNQTTPQQPQNVPSTNSAPVFNNTPSSSMDNDSHKKIGPIVTTLVIVLLLVIAAIYLFASKVNQQIVPISDTTATTGSTAQQSVTPVTNTSDDLNSLQNDLNASTNGVDHQSL